MIDDYLGGIVKNIPKCIKDLHIWLCYDDRDKQSYARLDDKEIDRQKKKPRDLRGRGLKNWNSRCYTFDECIDSIKDGFNSGFGVVVDKDLVGLDFDHCIKGYKKMDNLGLEIPILSKEIQEIVNRLDNSYVEISQSGKGLHCLVYSSVAIPRQTKPTDKVDIEIYANKNHFMRLSGNVLNNNADDIEILDKTDLMLDIYSKYFEIQEDNVDDVAIKVNNISFRDDEYRKQFYGLKNKYDKQEILDNLFRIGGSFYQKLYNNELSKEDIDQYNSKRIGRGLKDTSNSGLSVLLILNLMYYSYGADDIVYELWRESKLYDSKYDKIAWKRLNLTKGEMIYNYCKSRFINFKIQVDKEL